MSVGLAASDEDLRNRFASMRTPQDVAALLDVSYERLRFCLYVLNPSQRYARFSIPKASGGMRQILAPAPQLKWIQRNLASVLARLYQPKYCVHGFVVKKSIVTNARIHRARRYVFNVDLKDFFPSINFGRVRGMFIATPYKLEPSVATVLAQICCFENQLPQGAPTSPIISNMICAKMDSQLIKLAKSHRCTYSRYADDLTFSTQMSNFPTELARLDQSGEIQPGEELQRIINQNGFEINNGKVRLQTRLQRQEVTGLTTNKFPNVRRNYVRQIRAMLHAWEKFGIEAVQDEFSQKYDRKHRRPLREAPDFRRVVRGKIDFLGMVRGKDDVLYAKLYDRLATLVPELPPRKQISMGSGVSVKTPIIFTEGKTDQIHLENALREFQSKGQFQSLSLKFPESNERDTRGNQLVTMCESYAKGSMQASPHIFVFDRDVKEILSKVSDPPEQRDFKDWGNNVFSFLIPIPDHRQETPQISIEFYYTDEEITRRDNNGRRLFINNEFDKQSARHKSEDLNTTDLNALKRSGVCIIAEKVFDNNNKSVALSKNDFAQNIANQVLGFHDFDVKQFGKIFELIRTIAASADQA